MVTCNESYVVRGINQSAADDLCSALAWLGNIYYAKQFSVFAGCLCVRLSGSAGKEMKHWVHLLAGTVTSRVVAVRCVFLLNVRTLVYIDIV